MKIKPTAIEKEMLNTIIQGDCLEVMRDIKADVVITDPPFNVGKDFENDNLSDLDWRGFCNKFALRLYEMQPKNILVEVSKKDSVMRQEIERYFPYRYSIILNYTNSMRNGVVGYANYGLVLWFGEGKCVERYKDRIDSSLTNTKKQFSHPSPKELAHYKRLVRMFTEKDDVVLDPFAGSGTTLKACKELGINYIGIEISPEYCKIAEQRLAQGVLI